jgi:hypothetical protein
MSFHQFRHVLLQLSVILLGALVLIPVVGFSVAAWVFSWLLLVAWFFRSKTDYLNRTITLVVFAILISETGSHFLVVNGHEEWFINMLTQAMLNLSLVIPGLVLTASKVGK